MLAPYYFYDSVDSTFLAAAAVDRKAPIFGILLGLAGCNAASGVSIVADRQSGYFAPEEYAQDATRGDIPVVVRGAAFGLDQPALEKLVIENMRGAEWGRHAHFAAATASSVDHRFFYVVMVNPAANDYRWVFLHPTESADARNGGHRKRAQGDHRTLPLR